MCFRASKPFLVAHPVPFVAAMSFQSTVGKPEHVCAPGVPVWSEQPFAGAALGAPLAEPLQQGLETEPNSSPVAAGHVLLELVLAPGL